MQRAGLFQLVPLVAKTHDFLIMLGMQGVGGASRNHNSVMSIGIMDSNGLVFICKVAHNTLSEDIKGTTKENLVCW